MKLALNYSRQAAVLVGDDKIDIDLWKCPPWPDMIAEAKISRPVCVHFALDVGAGRGDAIDSKTKQPADWRTIEDLMRETETQFINLHLSPKARDYPTAVADPLAAEIAARVRANLLRDVQAVVARLGPERVIVENDNANGPNKLLAAVLPETITEVVESAECGFLFDLSHARLAAYHLGVEEEAYIGQLPVHRTRELHITGIQTMDAAWVERFRRHGLTSEQIGHYAGRKLDHTPLTDADWEFIDWAGGQLQAGQWGNPALAAVEIGGEGAFWQATFDAATMVEQIPRLAARLAAPPKG